MASCHVLLDDRDASAAQPRSRLYEHFVREHRCTDPAQLDTVCAAVDADQRAGLHAVLLADYEWGARLLKAGNAALAADAGALRVLMFTSLRRLSRTEVDAWLAEREGAAEPGPAGLMQLQASVDRPAFIEAIGRIHEAIRAGETYQVNYTYRLQGEAHGTPVALYRRLRARQPVSYGAWISLPPGPDGRPGGEVLSCSPELFLRHESGVLTARPMKGTASRINGPEADSETARHLSLDTKNRAENLMIVDLLRNDLGRLAVTGSVTVPQLFDIEPYTTVFQMTSTVQARPRPEVGLPELLRAVFPCGSITGAPKHHTMGLIAQLESTPRGLYCGAIGWLDAPAQGQRLGDFCLSVAIRTLTLDAAEAVDAAKAASDADADADADAAAAAAAASAVAAVSAAGRRTARLGVGAGIVLDSVAADEYEECRLKARFVTGLDPGLALFETLHASREGGARHLDRHLARLSASAAAFGFPFDTDAARSAVDAVLATLPPGLPHRLRLELTHDGRLSSTHAPLAALPDGPVGLLISRHRLPDADPLAAHKTTRRVHYDAGIRDAEQTGAFDSLFFTANGRLAEGGRSNVFLRLDGCWYTPPLTDGALPGVMRGLLLSDPTLAATERSLGLDDLKRADALLVCNALRGALPARLLPGQ
jgi:para-aminobenzoate synthetase / 4-amino-4-deoxychorismate lyase